jgi:uncharacterized FAD-dependent dehydrogenase
MRKIIEAHGGQIMFNAWVTDIVMDDANSKKISGLQLNGKEIIKAENVILATGHSARDIFQLLADRKIRNEAKPFAIGVRVEHPQPFMMNVNMEYHPGDHYCRCELFIKCTGETAWNIFFLHVPRRPYCSSSHCTRRNSC